MRETNGGYVIIKLEKTKDCSDKILKFFGKKPILLILEDGRVTRLQNAIALGTPSDTLGADLYELRLWTDAGVTCLAQIDGDSAREWIIETILPQILDVDDLDLSYAGTTEVYKSMTDENVGKWIGYVNAGIQGMLKVIIDENGDFKYICGGKSATYTYSTKDYNGVVIYAKGIALFVGVNWLATGKEMLFALIGVDDVTPAGL